MGKGTTPANPFVAYLKVQSIPTETRLAAVDERIVSPSMTVDVREEHDPASPLTPISSRIESHPRFAILASQDTARVARMDQSFCVVNSGRAFDAGPSPRTIEVMSSWTRPGVAGENPVRVEL